MNLSMKLVREIAGTENDFEWYPTTTEIIKVVKFDIYNKERYRHLEPSVLDCGAGDGRALMALSEGKKYAIEKSRPLLNALDKAIFVVGTDFHQQTLIDKKVDILFSNPPYSEYETWATKIIREASCDLIYLVIPERWESCRDIIGALDSRQAKANVIGRHDFLNADRAARAKVHVVRIELGYGYRTKQRIDSFELWFNEHFKLDIEKEGDTDYQFKSAMRSSVKEKAQHELVQGGDLVQVLEQLYRRDLEKLMQNYKALETIDPELLRELDVDLCSLKEALRLKIVNLKDVYWREFFDRMERITRRLTTTNRKNMLDKLTSHTHVDFSIGNAYALTIWAIKNANGYFDDQLTQTFEKLVRRANVVNYKSNSRTFTHEQWRWHNRPSDLERFGLDYRIVLDRVGGIVTSSYSQMCLNGCAVELLNDLRTVADNLGFSVEGFSPAEGFDWESNKLVVFHCTDRKTSHKKPLMGVRAFKNGNLHIKFDQDFMARFNVEFGRLKGWIRSHAEAAEELQIDPEMAEQSFASQIRLTPNTVALLGFHSEHSEKAA